MHGFVHEFVQESGGQVWRGSLGDKSGGPKSGVPNLEVMTHPYEKTVIEDPSTYPLFRETKRSWGLRFTGS